MKSAMLTTLATGILFLVSFRGAGTGEAVAANSPLFSLQLAGARGAAIPSPVAFASINIPGALVTARPCRPRPRYPRPRVSSIPWQCTKTLYLVRCSLSSKRSFGCPKKPAFHDDSGGLWH